jgi:predicted nucleic acid-binding protein
MTESARGTVVCDAGPIIHLDELDSLRLIGGFQQVIVPDPVHEEVKLHRPGCLEKSGLKITREAIQYPLREETAVLCRLLALDSGETAALGLMEKYPGAIFLSDDCAARLAAERMGYAVHGTIGIIVRAIRMELMSAEDVLRLLRELPRRSTLYIRQSLLEEIISQVEKSADLSPSE